MTEETCAVLTAIFPLVLVTVALERGAIHVRIRRKKWFRGGVQVVVVASVVGVLATVIGVESGGLIPALGWLVWTAFGVAFIGLALSLIAALASQEVKEDRKKP